MVELCEYIAPAGTRKREDINVRRTHNETLHMVVSTPNALLMTLVNILWYRNLGARAGEPVTRSCFSPQQLYTGYQNVFQYKFRSVLSFSSERV